jgi:Mn-dependent DtxR family transcriptional regulator
MENTMTKLLESGEMYLETIYILSLSGGAVRSLDVAEYMNFSKPSVSRAVGLLRSGGYITVDEVGTLSLTPAGETVAKSMYERHTILSDFLVGLGVDRDVATDDACKIEHHLSEQSFDAIKKWMKR